MTALCARLAKVSDGSLAGLAKVTDGSDQIWLWYVLAVCAGLQKVNTGSLCRSG